jgi:hypothetical protein
LPTAVFAAPAFAVVIPPGMYSAIIWAMDVSGVTWTPVVVEPVANEGTQLVITSPACMVMGVPVASSAKEPPFTCNITGPA